MPLRLSKHIYLFAALSFATPLVAALNILVNESRNVILPKGSSFVAGEVLTVKKGDVFYRQPLGRSHATASAEDISFAFIGQPVVIGKSDQLIHSTISGVSAGQIGPGDSIYCTVAKRTGKKRVVGLSEIGAIGMDFDAIAKLRNIQTQSCVIDTDGDDVAEKAFVADTSNRETIIPVAIKPTKLLHPGLRLMPGESEARMVFDGPVGILGNMSTSFRVVEEGQPLAFGNGQTLFSAGSLPHTVSPMGGSFTILAYDGKTKSAQIRIDRPFFAGEYAVTTEYRRR